MADVKYRKNFRSGNVFTHVSAAFASRFLIRMTTLVPEVVDARRIGRDVEQLAIMLSQGTSTVCAELTSVPGFQFASLLRDVIQKARRNKTLPPASRPGSPTRNGNGQVYLPSWSGSRPSAQSVQSASSAQPQSQDFKFAFDQPSEPFPALDFSYAEQLLGNTAIGPDTSSTNMVCLVS